MIWLILIVPVALTVAVLWSASNDWEDDQNNYGANASQGEKE